MTTVTSTPNRRLRLLAGSALLLGALVALVWVASATGKGAEVLGKVGGKAPPSCPTPRSNVTAKDPKTCFALASVTAFQMVANGERAAFKVPSNGHVVAWSVKLSSPTDDERASFTNEFKFGEPSARLAILKEKDKGKFKLTKRSPKVSLTDQFGREPIFALDKPLKVKKGTIVGLSTSNWIPNLAHDGALTADEDKWRASRGRKKCGTDPQKSAQQNQDDVLASKAQRKIGTVRTYGCTYSPARILYQAYYVPGK